MNIFNAKSKEANIIKKNPNPNFMPPPSIHSPIKPSKCPMPAVKPPLGIVTKHIWDCERIVALKGAMVRYIEASREIPSEWVEEYNELIKRGANDEMQ
jgi:hypothetical protein